MDGRANAHHLPRGRDDQQRLAEEDERHARREYGRAAATLGYAQLLEEATASPVLKLPKLLLCGHDPTARAERHTRRQPSCARVARAGDSLCADTWTAPMCVCPLSNLFPIGVETRVIHPPPAGTRAGTARPGTRESRDAAALPVPPRRHVARPIPTRVADAPGAPTTPPGPAAGGPPRGFSKDYP